MLAGNRFISTIQFLPLDLNLNKNQTVGSLTVFKYLVFVKLSSQNSSGRMQPLFWRKEKHGETQSLILPSYFKQGTIEQNLKSKKERISRMNNCNNPNGYINNGGLIPVGGPNNERGGEQHHGAEALVQLRLKLPVAVPNNCYQQNYAFPPLPMLSRRYHTSKTTTVTKNPYNARKAKHPQPHPISLHQQQHQGGRKEAHHHRCHPP